ncbi:hypothetical protein NQ314_002317 [Rhamnusium bicolor]|uniref:Partial AB-hydrolase lipase domain-containing protein n=1 Tax=Rhamnusium bicolor TaxID=1586634 RepID=A0AAV8ZQQ6_9CUCU|nr:hypothetical protein NQ314_002317 [Rhamnusium bicolor]
MVKSEVRVLPSDDVTIGDFSITDFISEHGYPVETHKGIQTFDGYLLDVHRIPHGKSNGNDSRLPVVLLMHGLVGSSENWILLGPDKSLAFLLADEGYDVWMGNARGNKHSRKHINFDPDKDSQYWMFSWHEIGVYDLPAIIDYILKKTGNRKLMYVGHSQGTTTFFVMASEKPQYNRYIKVMAALAPVAFMSKGLGPLMQLVSLSLSGISVSSKLYRIVRLKYLSFIKLTCRADSQW